MKLKVGDAAPPFRLADTQGVIHATEDYRGGKLLLSFHRYAACPLCNLHIHELSAAYPFLDQHGLRILAVFMSPAERVAEQYRERDVPFPLVSDAAREVYDRYGVEYSVPGMLAAFVHPRAMRAFFSGFFPGRIDAATTTLPADFLIGPDLRIVSAHYSTNITQHMPLQTIREYAAGTV